jgi:hypothetical protein
MAQFFAAIDKLSRERFDGLPIDAAAAAVQIDHADVTVCILSDLTD